MTERNNTDDIFMKDPEDMTEEDWDEFMNSRISAPKTRVQKDRIDRLPYVIKDPELSDTAVRIHDLIIAKPSTLRANMEYIQKYTSSGEKATKRGIRELINAGYAHKYRARKPNGTFDTTEYLAWETKEETAYWIALYDTPGLTDSEKRINIDKTKTALAKKYFKWDMPRSKQNALTTPLGKGGPSGRSSTGQGVPSRRVQKKVKSRKSTTSHKTTSHHNIKKDPLDHPLGKGCPVASPQNINCIQSFDIKNKKTFLMSGSSKKNSNSPTQKNNSLTKNSKPKKIKYKFVLQQPSNNNGNNSKRAVKKMLGSWQTCKLGKVGWTNKQLQKAKTKLFEKKIQPAAAATLAIVEYWNQTALRLRLDKHEVSEHQLEATGVIFKVQLAVTKLIKLDGRSTADICKAIDGYADMLTTTRHYFYYCPLFAFLVTETLFMDCYTGEYKTSEAVKYGVNELKTRASIVKRAYKLFKKGGENRKKGVNMLGAYEVEVYRKENYGKDPEFDEHQACYDRAFSVLDSMLGKEEAAKIEAEGHEVEDQEIPTQTEEEKAEYKAKVRARLLALEKADQLKREGRTHAG